MINNKTLVFATLTDGRKERMSRVFPSWKKNLNLDLFDRHVIFDSSGDISYNQYLNDTYPFEVIALSDSKLSLPAAFNAMFSYINNLNMDLTFFTEDDFEFPEPIPFEELSSIVLDNNLSQLILPRQAWYDYEIDSGGLIQFINKNFKLIEKNNWIEHQALWSNNPSLINNIILSTPYPLEMHRCESVFYERIKSNYYNMKSGYYGNLEDKPKCIHRG